MKPRALVTGASRGIGAAIAEALAAAGHPIVLNYRSDDAAAEAVAARIRAAGGEAVLSRFDVGDDAAADAAMAAILADPRPLGVVVNNAGIARDAPFPALERADWEAVLRTSLGGFYNVTRPVIMPMVRRKWGRIITMSSVSAQLGNRGQVAYAAAKAGVIGATKSLALELARKGVTVNAVAPGLVDTDMIKDVPLEHVMPRIPAQRLGTAPEVAAVVAFLASDAAAYITGQVIGINGGMV
ncbi:3-oxoacyl-ACP reductase FabG [Nannocystis bainbridge]|uniref:3-oxoacyl-ACP reductase FabG n=1 Tax=Nannocystis bainbridge TaxID=2995303 RepID=A0ABT5EA23_9BACT|nr:3-oxoacyl-ACP reductase FabG [Nannocystis bainbridge]MDC0722708.1 3-oxoacyl-ACP reductase FabG [Nannocystis bainbridge]